MALRGRWTKEDIRVLKGPQLRALKKNAERANDDLVASWCEEALQHRTTTPRTAGSPPEEDTKNSL